MARLSSYALFFALALLAGGLYLVKYEVQAIKDRNIALRQQIRSERMALHLLQAEWVYLNRPDRLERLANQYLDLQAVTPQQVVSWADIPLREQQLAAKHGAR